MGKTSALLYYLAYQADWVDRADIVYLIWPDTEEKKARRNLRQLLNTIRSLTFAQDLEIEDQRLRWCTNTDVRAFEEALSQQQWTKAVQCFDGILLEGFRADGIPEFESWLEFERLNLFNSYRNAAFAVANELVETRRYHQAAELLAHLRDFEPLDEEVLRRYLELLTISGKRNDALGAYENFRQQLDHELGYSPEAATNELVERIQAGRVGHGRNHESSGITTKPPPAASSVRTTPVPATRFVGRESEISDIVTRLQDRACRLLTIVAAGGMGKTRLAIEVANRLESTFSGGVCFVPLESVASPDQMVAAIARALDFSFFGQQDPKAQLFEYLEDLSMLLVADNMEHLVDAAPLFSELLETAPDLGILATSRQCLGLQLEWLYDLSGMGIADNDDAFSLFVQTANRVRADFRPAANRDCIIQICEHVGGMPLAIELAASWLRILKPRDILTELKQGMETLTTSMKDMPERHHDIRKVFDTSWQRLSAAEQTALEHLSVFHGGFDRDAAKTVTSVGLPFLLGLCNKSFLRRDDSGRFGQHPLMWRFLREKAKQGSAFAAIQDQHAAYFAGYLKDREVAQAGLDVASVQREITGNLANIFAAWEWMVQHKREDLLEMALWSLCEYFLGLNRFQEGDSLLSETEKQLDQDGLVRARLLHRLGIFNISLGNFEKSASVFTESLAISRQHQAIWDEAHALYVWGMHRMFTSGNNVTNDDADTYQRCAALFREANDPYQEARALVQIAGTIQNASEREALLHRCLEVFRETQGYFELTNALCLLAIDAAQTRGAFAEALSFIEEALAIERKRNNTFRTSWFLNIHGYISADRGHYEQSRQSFEEALALSKKHQFGGVFKPNQSLYGLGWLAHAQGEYSQAEGYFLEALELEMQFEHPLEQAGTMNALCRVATSMGNVDKARSYCRQIDAILGSIGEHAGKWVETKRNYLHNIAMLHLAQNKPDEAEPPLHEAMRLSLEWSAFLILLELLVTYSELLQQQGELEQAARILTVVSEHEGCPYPSRQSAQRRLASLPEGTIDNNSRALGIEAVVENLLAKDGL